MDRPLDTKHVTRRRARRGTVILAVISALLVLVFLLPGWIRPSVGRERIRTAMVERGDVEATITASGLMVPEHEHVITSPIASRVREIHAFPGDTLRSDDLILQPGEIGFFTDVFGARAKIYPIGGHCGNMDYKANVDHMLSLFTDAGRVQ